MKLSTLSDFIGPPLTALHFLQLRVAVCIFAKLSSNAYVYVIKTIFYGDYTMTKKQLYAVLLGSTALASSISFNAMADVGIEPVPAYMEDNMAVGYAKKAFNALPDLGVTDKVYAVAQNRAEKQLGKLTDEVAEKVKSFLEWKIYGLADRHTIGLDGKKNGYVVMNDSRLFRSIIEKVTGLEADSLLDFGFGSKATGKFLLNKLENYVADMLLNGVQDKVARTSSDAIVSALGVALHLTEDRVSQFLSSPIKEEQEETIEDFVRTTDPITVDIEGLTSGIEESLKKANIDADVTEHLSEGEIEEALAKDSRMQTIFSGLKAQISLYFLGIAEEATHEITEWAAQKIIDDSMHQVQVGVTAGTTVAATALSPTLAILYGAGMYTDHAVSDTKNKSYTRTFVDWAFGAKTKQKQLQLAAETKARSLIESTYNTFFGALEDDLSTVYGTYETRALDDEGFEGWVALEPTSAGFSLQDELVGIGSDIVSGLTKKVSDAVGVVTETVVATASIAKDVAMVVPNQIASDNEYMAEIAQKRGGGFMAHASTFFDAMNGHLDDDLEEAEEEVSTPVEQSSWWNPMSW